MNGGTRPPACPFVAFDDDRDRRSETPDPRHRCFAVPNPEPRAIAHQQAYCLTPNFPSCAFFMDWAARAAAAPLAGSAAGFGAAPLPGSGYGAYGVPGGQAGQLESPGAADPGGRVWAAPPPWVGDPDLRATQVPPAAWSPPPQPLPPPAAPLPQPPSSYVPLAQPGAQAWSGTPQPVMPQPVPAQPATPQPIPSQPVPSPTEPEQLLALPEPEEPEIDRDYDLSGEAPLYANPDPQVLPVPMERNPGDEPVPFAGQPSLSPLPPVAPQPAMLPLPVPAPVTPPAVPMIPSAPTTVPSLPAEQPYSAIDAAAASAGYTPTGPDTWSHPGLPIGSKADDVDPGAPLPGEARSRLTGRPIDVGGPPRFTPQARQPLKKNKDGEWSSPRRFEAYPTLGGRMRGFSPILIGAFAIALVALLLFLLPGFLGGAPAATHTPAAATATPIPTPAPEPTPAGYTVKAGDTLSAVAKGLGRTVDQMACFNNLKNVNSLSIGQVLLVPPPDYVCPSKPTPTKK